MKKIIFALAFVVMLTAISGVAYATTPTSGLVEDCELVRPIQYGDIQGGVGETIGPEDGDAWGAVCVINTINRAAQTAFFIMLGLVAALVIIGGFTILTAGADTEKVEKGKKWITYAVVGIIVAAFAYAVPAMINFILS